MSETIITGRNNTGKTSLLEAINLVLNPNSIQSFGSNLHKIINVRSEECKIIASTDKKKLEIQLEKPAYEDVMAGVRENLKENIRFLQRHFARDKEFELTKDIKNEINKLSEEKLDEDSVEKLSKDGVNIIRNGNRASYFDFSGDDVAENILYQIMDSIYTKSFPGIIVRRSLTQGKMPKGGKGVFIKDLIPTLDKEKGEKEAVTVHEIDKYIKKHGLVKNLEKFDTDYLLFRRNQKTESIPYDFMGDGFKAMVGLLWRILPQKRSDSIVLVEEPENHMHPGYIDELVNFIIKFSRERKIQFFITSHDMDFIKSFFRDNLSPDNRNYLNDQFNLIRMEKTKGYITSKCSDYGEAKSILKDLQIDLRGI